MELPIYIYNDKILSEPGQAIDSSYPNVYQLITDMFETMYAANGIGLAAHQIGQPIKLFVVDLSSYFEHDEKLKDFKKVFINSEILEDNGEEKIMNEGCLSLPGVHIDIKRKEKIKLKYLDENFIEHEEWFDGLAARCIQHEHDHTNGIIFINHISLSERVLLQNKLRQIVKRKFSTNYKYKT